MTGTTALRSAADATNGRYPYAVQPTTNATTATTTVPNGVPTSGHDASRATTDATYSGCTPNWCGETPVRIGYGR